MEASATESLLEGLCSSDVLKQINCLLALNRINSAGNNTSNYIPTVIKVVLNNSNHKTVRKLCYQLIRGSTVEDDADWDVVVQSILKDLKKSNDNDRVKIHAVRAICSVSNLSRLRKFFSQHAQVLQGFITPAEQSNKRSNAAQPQQQPESQLRRQIVKAVQYFHISTNECTIEDYGTFVINAIRDSSQEVANAAFDLLRTLICGDCKCYFHEEKIPIAISPGAKKWINFVMEKCNFNELVSRAKCMDVRTRLPAMRPLAYMALVLRGMNGRQSQTQAFDQDYLTEVAAPALRSGENSCVLEAGHCIMILFHGFQSVPVLDVINAYLELINRHESMSSCSRIMHDICAVFHLAAKDKYYIAASLLHHIRNVSDCSERLYIMSTLYRSIVANSMEQRRKEYLKNPSKAFQTSEGPSEIEQLSKEAAVKKYMLYPKSPFEEQLRAEMTYSMLTAVMELEPSASDSPEEQKQKYCTYSSYKLPREYGFYHNIPGIKSAWIIVAMEVLEQALTCVCWEDQSITLITAQFAKAFIRVCQAAAGSSITRDAFVNKIMLHLLHMLPVQKEGFARLITLCLLASYMPLNLSTSGKDSGDILFDNVREFIQVLLSQRKYSQQAMNYLIYCLLYISFRFPSKLKETHSFILSILNNPKVIPETLAKFQSAIQKVDIGLTQREEDLLDTLWSFYGEPLNEEHPLFNSEFSAKDKQFLLCVVDGAQAGKEIQYNLESISLANAKMYHIKSEEEVLKNEKPKDDKSESLMDIVDEKKRENERLMAPVFDVDCLMYSEVISHSSDPLRVEATYYLHPRKYKIELHLKIHNTTEDINFKKLRVSVGVEGSLQLFDKIPQAIRLIEALDTHSSCDFVCEYIARVWDFNSFHVSLSTNLASSSSAGDDEADILNNTNKNESANADVVTIRCAPFSIKMMHLLRPASFLSLDHFLHCWSTFPSALHIRSSHPSPRADNTSVASVSIANDVKKIMGIIAKKPFYLVSQKKFTGNSVFELCYASRTLFGRESSIPPPIGNVSNVNLAPPASEYILFTVFGSLHPQTGDCICDWEFRSVSEDSLSIIRQNRETWFSELTDGACRILREDECFFMDDISVPGQGNINGTVVGGSSSVVGTSALESLIDDFERAFDAFCQVDANSSSSSDQQLQLREEEWSAMAVNQWQDIKNKQQLMKKKKVVANGPSTTTTTPNVASPKPTFATGINNNNNNNPSSGFGDNGGGWATF